MKDKGADIKIGVGVHPPCICLQYQVVSDVWQPVVMPHDTCAWLGGFDPNTSHANVGVVSKLPVGCPPDNYLGEVSGILHRLFYQGASVREYLVKL